MKTKGSSPSKSVIAALALLCASSQGSFGALTAYYTLDDLTAGILNRGTDGVTSDLTPAGALLTPTPVADGIIGGALSFDGGDLLLCITPDNAADDLQGYNFTMSMWVRSVVVDTTRDTVMTISDRASGGRYYGTGVQGVSGKAEPELIRRNPNFTELNATGQDVSASIWVNIVSVFQPGGAQIYVNGSLAGSITGGETFNASVNTLTIGGFLRNGSTTTPTDPFSGQADDVGLFDTPLLDADVALINGLGRTGGIGLDQLDEAQALNAMTTGSIGSIGGATWQKVSGLFGGTGSYGGSVSAGTAYIVTDAFGNGLQVIPEPGTTALLGVAVAGFAARRRRSRC